MEPSNLHPEHRVKDGKLSDTLQWEQDLHTFRDMRDPVQSKGVERVVVGSEHMYSRSGDMQADNRDPNPKLPSRVHGVDHADKSRNVSRPVWEFVFHTLGDYIRHVRKVDHKPNKPDVAGQPAQPCVSCESHKCERHNERNCNCARGTCADDDIGDASGNYTGPRLRAPEPNKYGNFRCPITGQLCSSSVCREWCEGSGTGTEIGVDRRYAKAAQYYRNTDSKTGAS